MMIHHLLLFQSWGPDLTGEKGGAAEEVSISLFSVWTIKCNQGATWICLWHWLQWQEGGGRREGGR